MPLVAYFSMILTEVMAMAM